MSRLDFSVFAFYTNFFAIKIDLSGNTVWPRLQVFKNSPNWPFLTFNELFKWDNFCTIKSDFSGNPIWLQALGFQKLTKLTIFGILNELLSTQNVNVARFARNVECDFLYCMHLLSVSLGCKPSFIGSPYIHTSVIKDWPNDCSIRPQCQPKMDLKCKYDIDFNINTSDNNGNTATDILNKA